MESERPAVGVTAEVRWRAFGGLMLLAAVASAASVPYTLAVLEVSGRPSPGWEIALSVLPYQLVYSASAAGVGLAVGPRLGLVLWQAGTRRRLVITGLAGLGLGLASGLASPALERTLLPEASTRAGDEVARQLAVWDVLLGSAAAAVLEELLFRFGLMTCLVWLGGRRARGRPAAAVYWGAIVAAALAFGLTHLSNVAVLRLPVTAGTVLYVLAGNVPGGVLFGWLYWRRGLVAAMLAHLLANVALKVVAPAVVA